MSDEGRKKKVPSKTRKLVPNVTGRLSRGIKKETKRPSCTQKTSAVFEELVEAAQKESKWERGDGRARHASYKAASFVVFGATSSAPKMEPGAQTWGGEKPLKKEYKMEELMEIGEDEASFYPTLLPMKPPGEHKLHSRYDSHNLLPQYVEKKLAEFDGHEDDTSAMEKLKLDCFSDSCPLLFQIPSVLPMLMKKSEENGTVRAGLLDELNEGKIGKLLIYRSGKMCLQLGDVILDVSGGTPHQFHQQLVAINIGEENGHCVFMGDIPQRVTCTFNIHQMLDPDPPTSQPLETATDSLQENVAVKEEGVDGDQHLEERQLP